VKLVFNIYFCKNELFDTYKSLFMAIIRNKDLLQSYVITTAKYDFSTYEKRIIYRIIELLQHYTEGQKLNEKQKINLDLFGDAHIEMPIAYFLKDEQDKHHSEIKKALSSLEAKKMTYEDDKSWQIIRLIEKPIINKYSSLVSFRLNTLIYNAFLNFSKGYRKYELKIAMQFESVYAMRFYELMSGQKQPITYSIDNLKEMFQIQEKYERVNDFKKYVLDIAIRELDKCSPYTFTYKMNKTGRSFTSVTFYPKYQPQFRDPELEKKDLQKQISPAWDLSKNTLDYLINSFDFTQKEIKQNIDLLKQAQAEIENFINFMSQVKPRANRAKNPKGYLINSIKKELKR